MPLQPLRRQQDPTACVLGSTSQWCGVMVFVNVSDDIRPATQDNSPHYMPIVGNDHYSNECPGWEAASLLGTKPLLAGSQRSTTDGDEGGHSFNFTLTGSMYRQGAQVLRNWILLTTSPQLTCFAIQNRYRKRRTKTCTKTPDNFLCHGRR
jgi:hypothetical protein